MISSVDPSSHMFVRMNQQIQGMKQQRDYENKFKVEIQRDEQGETRSGARYVLCRGEEYNMHKRERGSNIICPIILRLLGRISSGGKGKGTEILGKKIQIKKKWGMGTNV